jgi:hypothetical protein
MNRLVMVLLVFLSASNILIPANISIGGTISDNTTDEPLIGATVMLQGTKLGARTNKSGFYSIQNVPTGEYTIIARYMGYVQGSHKVSVKQNSKDIRINIGLVPDAVTAEEVKVFADREVEKREISISKVNIPVAQIKDIRVGGESDLFRSLQFLPGVLTSSQISSGLYVRGGSPDQNLVLLDGATVYNPSHLFGFYSTFNTNAIKDVEFIKGGFDAEYGGRLSSVLNVTQKDGNKKEINGDVTIGMISSQGGIEVPVGNGAMFLSGRRTYLDLMMPILRLFTDAEIPDFYFYDINAKITQNFGDNDKVSISGFLGQDAMDFSGFSTSILMDVGNRLISSHWTHIFSNNFFSNVVFNYSKYRNNFSGGQTDYNFILDNSIEDMTAKVNFEYLLGEETSIKFGGEVSKINFDFLINFTGDTTETTNDAYGQVNLFLPDWNYTAFAQTKFNLIDYLSVQGGLRAYYFYLNNSFKFDPRIALRYMLTGNVALKAAWGIYHQSLRIAGFPNFSIVDAWLPSDTSVEVSKANHYVFSVEIKPFEEFNLNFDVYYKDMYHIGELNQMAFMQLRGAEKVTDVMFIGDAYSYGAEIFVQRTSGRLTGWLGYSYGMIWAKFDSINHGNEFHPKYDRTHDFKVVAQYKLFNNWEIGGTFTFQTGQSYTGATSRGQILLPDQTRGNSKTMMSDLYGLRLPNSHQLNIYLAHTFNIFGKEARAVLDIYNVYNRRDILMRVYNTRQENTIVEDVRLLPIIPSLSIEIDF